MKSFAPVVILIAMFLIIACAAYASPPTAHMAEFTVTGAPNNQDLKLTLHGILASRLNLDLVQLVEKPDQADLLVIGSYAKFGKMFSLDVLIKNRESNKLTKVFEQGEGEEDIIPALGRLAQKIDAELAKRSAITKPATTTAAAVVVPALPTPATTAVLAVPFLPPPYVTRSEPSAKETPGVWLSAPLEGVYSSIATGRTLSSGELELFVANDRTIRAYLKSSELRLVAEVTIPLPGKILAIDTADLDRDGIPELYVSIIDRETPSSRIYSFNGTVFSLLSENQIWFFRGIGTDIASRTIFAQEVATGGKFYGTIKELVKSDHHFTTKNVQGLPHTGNIFNCIKLNGASGKDYYVVLDEAGYLVVYSPEGTEAWKSSEKFGGSEGIVTTGAHGHSRITGDLVRWTFLEQRLTQLKNGTLLVPHNEGSFSFGNNRSFDKYSLFGLTWNGSVFKEKWRTRQSPGYLADYTYSQASGEVVLLEVVQKSGMFNKGKSLISINRIE